MPHSITLIPGDGTRPDITQATGPVLESLRRKKVAIKGPIPTPRGGGFRSVNVALRKMLDLYACLRPAKYYPGVRSRYQDVDLVIVRGNHEDLYAGVEFEKR